MQLLTIRRQGQAVFDAGVIRQRYDKGQLVFVPTAQFAAQFSGYQQWSIGLKMAVQGKRIFALYSDIGFTLFYLQDLGGGDVVGQAGQGSDRGNGIRSHACGLHRHPALEIAFEPAGEAVWLYCDRQQVGRALTNVLKNAAESIALRGSGDGAREPSGRIALDVVKKRDGDAPRVAVVIEDDGVGLPAQERDRLTEPYVTTREKGTGLGLAIVKKIMEDHFGDVVLEDRPQGGARVTLVFGTDEADAASAAEEGKDEKRSRARGMARAQKDADRTAAHGS